MTVIKKNNIFKEESHSCFPWLWLQALHLWALSTCQYPSCPSTLHSCTLTFITPSLFCCIFLNAGRESALAQFEGVVVLYIWLSYANCFIFTLSLQVLLQYIFHHNLCTGRWFGPRRTQKLVCGLKKNALYNHDDETNINLLMVSRQSFLIKIQYVD